MAIKDYTGEQFGLLKVIERLPNYKNNGHTFYKCDCECGGSKIISGSNLVTKTNKGQILHCGCLFKNHEYVRMKYLDGRKDKRYSVYQHTFPNGKVYIGITKNNVEERWKSGTGYNTQTLMKRAIKKYGWDNVKHEVIETNLTHDEACKREEYYIKLFKSNNKEYGYNATSGGDCGNNLVNPVIQYYQGIPVNYFESLRTASKLLDLSVTTIRNYSSGKSTDENYSFDVLDSTYDYDLDDKFFTFRNEEHLHIKGKILKIISTNTKNRNKSRCKKVNQYDLNGKYIRTFDSIKEAIEISGAKSLTSVLNENSINKSSNGFMWKYYDGNYDDIEPYHANGKLVHQIDTNSKLIIDTYKSLADAARAVGISSKQIWKACNKEGKQVKGFFWRYAD